MKINQVYNLFGSENLENFIYIQKKFPVIRRGQSSDIWMGIVQIYDYFPSHDLKTTIPSAAALCASRYLLKISPLYQRRSQPDKF